MNNEKPLVSIIIPFLNVENFIQEALESVLSQTYKEWEILLVDDGSTDNSTKIALDYQKENPTKIHYLEHDDHLNKGSSATRNLGIKHAKGKYITFLDADDVWLENKLEEQVEILESYTHAGMVYGNTKYWHSWTDDPEDLKRDFVVDYNINLNSIVSPPELLILALESKTVTPTPSNIMVRRDVVLRVGGFEDAFRGMHDDHAFLAKLFVCTSAYVADSCWDLYRKHTYSLSAVAVRKGEKASAELFYLNWLENYLLEQGIDNSRLWRAHRHRKWRYGHPNLFRLTRNWNRISSAIKNLLKIAAQNALPLSVTAYLYRTLKNLEYIPPVGRVRFGDLRRLKPLSNHWGSERGVPIDRYYIERFLASNTGAIKGRLLEFGDDRYTRKYGNNHIIQSDIINLLQDSDPKTTIVADITSAPHIESGRFDCIIFIQTLQLIYDFRAAIGTLYRILKPGGVLLASFPGISQTSGTIWNRYWCWNFTVLSAENIFNEWFPRENIEIKAYGNLLAATSFLNGLAADELETEELNYHDPRYEILITVKAIKP